jgi:hypothetical protein
MWDTIPNWVRYGVSVIVIILVAVARCQLTLLL